jgi:hypothetical protein
MGMMWLFTAAHISIQIHRNTCIHERPDICYVLLAAYVVLGLFVGALLHQQLTHGHVAVNRGHDEGCVSILSYREVKVYEWA